MDHGRLPELGRERQLPLEQVELPVVGRVVAVEVEPGLADGDRARVREALAELVEPLGVVAARSVWMDAEDRPDPVVPVGELQRGRRRVDGRRDGKDPFDTGLARARNQDVRRVLARVEVRVRVDHAAVEACRIRSSSSSTTLSSSLRKSGVGSRRACPGASVLGVQAPTQEP